MKIRCILFKVFFVSLFTGSASADAGFQPGNILTSSQNIVSEYTLDGQLVSQVLVPRNLNNEVAREILVLDDGRLVVFNGTFYPELSIYDGVSWRSLTVPGWSIPNNLSYGGLASIGNRVYVTDSYTASGGEARGIIEINIDTGVYNRFIDTSDYIDITYGEDGMLYALQNVYGAVDVIDPGSLTITRSLSLGHTSSSRGAVANATGEIFMVSWDDYIGHYDANAVLLNTLIIGLDPFDIDLDKSGRLITGSRFGQVVITDETLATFSTIQASSTNTFVALVPEQAPPPAPPILTGSHVRSGRWIVTTLNWISEVSEVDVYYNDQYLETIVNSTTATYSFNKKESQIFKVCNASTQDCSAEYVSN